MDMFHGRPQGLETLPRGITSVPGRAPRGTSSRPCPGLAAANLGTALEGVPPPRDEFVKSCEGKKNSILQDFAGDWS